MTICQALLWAREKLAKKSTSAELDAEVILSYILNKPREWILARYKKPFNVIQGRQDTRYKKNIKYQISNIKQISNSKLSKFKTLILRRAKGVPVAYLTHHKEFYGLDFYVDERVLVPRPETEMLIDIMIHEAGNMMQTKLNKKHLTIIDIGTGSGCIAISLFKTLMTHDSSLIPRIYATDISRDALTVARRNARKHHIKVLFLQGNLLEPIIKRKIRPDIIIANLPYLKPNQIKGDIKHEPRQALVGGKDGLKHYRQILRQISIIKIQDTRNNNQINSKSQISNFKTISNIQCPMSNKLLFINYYLLLEIDPSQAEKMTLLIKKYLPDAGVEIKKDLAGRERVAIITMHEARLKI